jgi:hypothetical protein
MTSAKLLVANIVLFGVLITPIYAWTHYGVRFEDLVVFYLLFISVHVVRIESTDV